MSETPPRLGGRGPALARPQSAARPAPRPHPHSVRCLLCASAWPVASGPMPPVEGQTWSAVHVVSVGRGSVSLGLPWSRSRFPVDLPLGTPPRTHGRPPREDGLHLCSHQQLRARCCENICIFSHFSGEDIMFGNISFANPSKLNCQVFTKNKRKQ